MKGTKSSTVTSTPISVKTSTAARLERSSLLQSTPSISNSTADTFPQSSASAVVDGGLSAATLTFQDGKGGGETQRNPGKEDDDLFVGFDLIGLIEEENLLDDWKKSEGEEE